MFENKANIFFHGHDHLFAKQDKDGIVYQEVPQPSAKNLTTITGTAYGYVNGILMPNRGYLYVTVSADKTQVDYIRTYLPSEENANRKNGEIAYTYTIGPSVITGINEIISNDPDKIAQLLLNRSATRDDLHSVETIIAALAGDSKKDAKLADAREHFARENLPWPDQIAETTELYTPVNDVNFLARLRDRIVNQGMQPLVEADQLIEAAVRIEHLEDLVFEKGTRGVREALAIIQHAAEDTAGTTTVKWDGKPAKIGRAHV